MTDYEKQLEEANERLRGQLERETARADKLEKKLKANEWMVLDDPDVLKDAPNKKHWEEWNNIKRAKNKCQTTPKNLKIK